MRFVVVGLLCAGCGVTTTRGQDGGGGGVHDGPNFTFDFAGAVCSPSDPPECDGDAIKTCRSDGTGWDFTPCANGCGNGACLCVPGEGMCQGADAYICGMDGQFHLDKTCPVGTQCQKGTCGDARCEEELMSTNPHALPTNAWPRFRHDNRNTGSTGTVVAPMPMLKWKTRIGGSSYGGQLGGLSAGPVVDQNNRIFIGGGDGDGMGGAYHMLNDKGVVQWNFSGMRGLGLSTPAVRADETSYFASSSALLFAVDPAGKEVWRYQVGSVSDSDPIVTRDGILIYSSDDGSVYALSPDGKLQWKSDPQTGPGEVDGGVAETCDGKLVIGGKNGWFKMDAATGKVLWKVPATGTWGALLSAPYITADGTIYGWDFGGMGYAIDANGMVIWQKQFTPNGQSAGAAVTKVAGTLYTVLNDGNLYAVDAANGATKWTKPVGDGKATFLLAGPVLDGNLRLYFNSHDGFVYSFDLLGNQLWRIPASGQANSGYSWAGNIAISNDGVLYVPGNDGFLYAFQ